MRVDQARHQHAPVCVDHADVGTRLRGSRARRYPLDDVAPHEHAGRRRQRGVLAIEDADVLKKRRPGGGQSGGVASSGPSSSASYCARPGWQSPTRSAADSSGGNNMRRKSRTAARTNEVLRRSLEFIAHAPLGKHETRHTTRISAAILERWMRVLVPLPHPSAPGARGRYIIFADKAVREELMRYETRLLRSGSFTKIVSKCEPISKTEKSKMARNSDCSRYHLFDMFRSSRFLQTNVG